MFKDLEKINKIKSRLQNGIEYQGKTIKQNYRIYQNIFVFKSEEEQPQIDKSKKKFMNQLNQKLFDEIKGNVEKFHKTLPLNVINNYKTDLQRNKANKNKNKKFHYLPGYDWSNDTECIDITVKIIVNQIDMASKLANPQVRSEEKNAKIRVENALEKSNQIIELNLKDYLDNYMCNNITTNNEFIDEILKNYKRYFICYKMMSKYNTDYIKKWKEVI